jgi:hypothetical protein
MEVTVRQYAAAEGVSLQTVYHRLWSGSLAGRQVLGRWLVSPEQKGEPGSAAGRLALDREKFFGRRPKVAGQSA